ncbi:ATP-binding cassette, subfamily F, member 3 [Thermoactinomyces sp. DSM 45891]|uniref:ribosomal protection-like ABC-F family protein n=1 Tax=Thermoactinomyces sp. DSM 45891 TaxID=1761907 RepID=UPI000912FFC9|nr:ABC-F type ribosomal protection protein [Thermoactinomyces sp. DSM 45891]SFX71024.1 ATP-binding cassette, subfamily F, member 3 [Thermoactinomyces sp. DSM 45891]
MLIQAKNIYKSFGENEVLQDIQLQINPQEKVGLIGANGAGKSTLLKIMIGQLLPDQGEMIVGRKAQIGYLAQQTGLQSERSIWDEVLQVFAPILAIEQKIRTLEAEISKEEIYSNEDQYQRYLRQYGSYQEEFEQVGGYSYEAKMRGALHGLGLGHLDVHHTKISEISGGQKTRVSLAKMLLEEPDLLILDEPTNYLDLQATEWLEQALKNYPGALLIVSHDRFFLDQLVQVIYEIERSKATRYVGNYSQYVVKKEERALTYEKLYEQQQKEIKKLEEFVQKNIARATTTKRAQSRRKTLERMERLDIPESALKQASIRFETSVTSGKEVLLAKNLSVGYEQPLIQDLSFRVSRGERIALLGPNGTGKSTLLKTIASQLSPLTGDLQFGTNVEVDYYDQEQKLLTYDKSVLDEIWDDYPTLDQTIIRSHLGQFLFQGDDVYKLVKDLSGGERARLSLVKLLLNQANFLLMDEPTNHLDLATKERLESALEEYPGTILFVSHDRYFIRRLSNRVWELAPDGITAYDGDYDWYLEKKALEQFEETLSPKNEEPLPKGDAYQHRKQSKEEQRRLKQHQRELQELEQTITILESRITDIQAEMCKEEVFSDPQRSSSLQKELQSLEEQLLVKTDEWTELADQT